MLNDFEIHNLINEQKLIDAPIIRNAHTEQNFKNKQNQSFKTWDYEIKSVAGNDFKIIINRHKKLIDRFSVIFQYIDENKKTYNLKRYNGLHGFHQNIIERNKIKGFHVHTATERYQKKNQHIEAYAEETNQFTDWKSAFVKLLCDCNIKQIDPYLHTFAEASQ